MRRASTVAVVALVFGVAGLTSQGGASSSSPEANRGADGTPNRYIKAKPKRVERGRKLTVQGRGYAARKKLRLKLGEPGGPFETVELIRTNRNGGFSERYRVRRRSETGKAVVVACRRSCTVRERDTFRVVR